MWLLGIGVIGEASSPGGGLGLGEPWDSLFKAGGATLLIILIALWTGRLYLPSTVKDKEERIAELEKDKEVLRQERDAAHAESKEAALWLRGEAVPLLTRNIDLIKVVTDRLEQRTTTRRT